MKQTQWLSTIIPSLLALLGIVLIIVWIGGSAADGLETRVPGQDHTPASSSDESDRPLVAEDPVRGPGQPADVVESWPAFRGAARDGISSEETPLSRGWPDDGPPLLWQVPMGDGYAGAAIANGCAYVLDYDDGKTDESEGDGGWDVMRCLSLADGRTVWENRYPAEVAFNHGMSRTTPAIAGDAVVSIGPRCDVACWDAATGQCRWLISMVREFGAVERQWYTGQCVLVDGDRVILAPCGPDAMLVALDLSTGQVIWKSPNPRGWKMSHASIMPMEFVGQEMYVYCGDGGTAGVAVEDGSLLWDEDQWRENFATSPSPLPLPDGRIFLSSGYDSVGAMILQLRDEGGTVAVEHERELQRTEFNSEQQTPILYEGRLYAVRKHRGGQLVCMDLQGQEIWNSGGDKFGHGPYLVADGMVVVLADDGTLVTAEATPDGYQPLDRYRVFPEGHEAWGPMALAGGYLVLRDFQHMACVDLRAK